MTDLTARRTVFNRLLRLHSYWRIWRKRGAAKMDHKLWAYWAWHGRYPK